MYQDNEDTITAVATPPGRGAISLIRVSGKEAFPCLSKLLRRDTSFFEGRRAHLAVLISTKGTELDRVLVTLFPGPNSYTGEDLAEITCHGSPVIVSEILDEFMTLGVRIARPGEFTLRAFLNGKLDLAQAEAVQDLVASQTSFQAELARRQLEGELSRELGPLKFDLIEIASHLETALEFVEDEVEPDARKTLLARLKRIESRLKRLEGSFQTGRIYHNGLKVVLTGKPNSGKSSLFNSLLRIERAIVTDLPGTTRDALHETIDVEGVPVTLVDTAGIREDLDVIEKLGVERSVQHLADADLILFVTDTSLDFDEEDRAIWDRIRNRGYILVCNKSDLDPVLRVPSEVVENSSGEILVSAKVGSNLEALAGLIVKVAIRDGDSGLEKEQVLLTSARHRECLNHAREWLNRAEDALCEEMSEEFVVHDLRKVMEFLGEITGETTNDEILGHIFASFCIGK